MTKENKAAPTGALIHDLFREVFRLQAVLASITDTVHEQAGLGTPQRKVLQILNKYGPATVPHIASRLGVTRQSVQTMCNRLIASGQAESNENPLHKRSRLIHISDTGLDALQQAQENENKIIEQTMPPMDISELTQATQLLARIRRQIESKEQ